MADIFNRITDSFGGAFSADSSTLTFAGADSHSASPTALAGMGRDAGLLVQQLQMNYSQQVTRLYEIGSAKMYYVGGRTQGQGTMGRILGPVQLSTTFLQKYANVCAADNVLQFGLKAGCDTDTLGTAGRNAAWRGDEQKLLCKFVVITSVGVSIAAQDMLVNSDVQFMFSHFSIDGGGYSGGGEGTDD